MAPWNLISKEGFLFLSLKITKAADIIRFLSFPIWK